MNEYGSLLTGFSVGMIGFIATLVHIRWTKKKVATTQMLKPHQEFFLTHNAQEEERRRAAVLAKQ